MKLINLTKLRLLTGSSLDFVSGGLLVLVAA